MSVHFLLVMKLKHVLLGLLLVYTAGLFVVATLPGSSQILASAANDKVVHFAEFFIFALILLTTLSYYDEKGMWWKGIVFSVVAIIISEVVQLFVPGRSFSVFDIAADVLGIAVAYLLVVIAKPRK